MATTMEDGVPCDPNVFNVVQLKEKLRAMGAVTSGNKAELISRLLATDPSGAWMRATGPDDEAYENDDDERVTDDNALEQTIMRRSASAGCSETDMQRELDLIRREKEVLERELRVTRREVELLRAGAGEVRRPEQGVTVIGAPISKINIGIIADLLPVFEGNGEFFDRWERQVLLLRDGYQLDDHTTRVLIVTRLKGRALEWFHSKAEHIQLGAERLLMAMKAMFARRRHKVAARKRFEERVWKRGEDFIDYYYDKTILANRVPIDDDEVVDYLIDGIPDQILRDQARIQAFGSAADLLRSFEKVTLRHATSINGGRTMGQSEEPRRNDGERGDLLRCFGCGQPGHLSARCPLKVRGAKCFRCNEFGHIAAKCAKASVKEANSIGIPRPMREKCCKSVQLAGRDVLALVDTGSDISLMRAEPYVRIGAPKLQECEVEFCGVGSALNATLGKFCETLTIDGDAYPIAIHVVADDLMQHDLLIGSDFLNSVDVTMREGEVTVSRPTDSSGNAKLAMRDTHYEVNCVDSAYTVESEFGCELSGKIHEDKVEEVIRNCVECILANKKQGKREGFLYVLDEGDVPLDVYHIDHLGPSPCTKRSRSYSCCGGCLYKVCLALFHARYQFGRRHRPPEETEECCRMYMKPWMQYADRLTDDAMGDGGFAEDSALD